MSAMSAINEAWHVLSDPARRARYDAGLRDGVVAGGGSAQGAPSPSFEPRLDPLRRYTDPPRFPWRFVVVTVVLGALAMLVVGALVEPPGPAPVDNLLQPGSCVTLDEARNEAAEVSCDGDHDAVVEQLLPFDALCPVGTESFRDRQGMGQACVQRS